MRSSTITTTITTLVSLNLILQVFDGLATYVGWERFGEANPLLRTGFEAWGAGPTLVIAKVIAAALLLWVAHVPRPTFAAVALTVTLSAYTGLSLIPWSVRLLPIRPDSAVVAVIHAVPGDTVAAEHGAEIGFFPPD